MDFGHYCAFCCSNGYQTAEDNCYILCFDESALMYLKHRTQMKLVVLLFEDPVSDERLADWSKSFYGVGAWVNILAPHWTPSGGYKNWIGNSTTDFVRRAHGYGLKVSHIIFTI